MKSILVISLLFTCGFAKANFRDTTKPVKVVTRCPSTLSARKQPLLIVNGKVIIDSLVATTLKQLDEKLIENIDVLKEATAKSIYGSAATYGALIIRTKQTDFSPKPFCKPPEYKYDNYTL